MNVNFNDFKFERHCLANICLSRHLSNIFSSGVLDEHVIVAKIATTTQYGEMEEKLEVDLKIIIIQMQLYPLDTECRYFGY